LSVWTTLNKLNGQSLHLVIVQKKKKIGLPVALLSKMLSMRQCMTLLLFKNYGSVGHSMGQTMDQENYGCVF